MVAQPNRKKASFVVTQLTWLCVLILYVQAASDLCLEVFFFFLCSFLCPFFSAFFFLHFHWNDTGMLASSSVNSVNNHRDPHHQRSIQLPAQSSPYLQLEATLLQWAAGKCAQIWLKMIFSYAVRSTSESLYYRIVRVATVCRNPPFSSSLSSSIYCQSANPLIFNLVLHSVRVPLSCYWHHWWYHINKYNHPTLFKCPYRAHTTITAAIKDVAPFHSGHISFGRAQHLPTALDPALHANLPSHRQRLNGRQRSGYQRGIN